MKLNKVKVITLCMLGLSQAHSMDLRDSVAGHEGAMLPSTANKDRVREFTGFQQQQQDLREKVLEFNIIRAYADKALQPQDSAHNPSMPPKSFTEIENWVSKSPDQANPHMLGQRVLSVSLDMLATTLSLNTSKPISAGELTTHVQSTKQKLKDTERFYLLRHFGQTELNIPQHELDQLQSWITNYSPVVAHYIEVTPLSFKCEFDHIFSLFASKVGRDFGKEFAAFEANEGNKKARVQLKQDLELYFQTNGLILPATLTTACVTLPIVRLGPAMGSEMAVPEDFDPSEILAQAKPY